MPKEDSVFNLFRLMFQAHPWHGIAPGKKAPATVNAFIEIVREWSRANPPGMGINWSSSLEVALRLIAWTWALVLFRTSPALTPEAFREIVQGIGAHAAHVEKYLSYYFSPNTHLTGEALGLFYLGAALPELSRASRWRDIGRGLWY